MILYISIGIVVVNVYIYLGFSVIVSGDGYK